MLRLYISILFLSCCQFIGKAQVQRNIGADISLLPAYEAANTPYYTSSGQQISDVLTYLRDNASMNSIRVRLHVNPDNSNKDGVVQDLDYVTKFGRRIKDAGMNFMLDFHYSDTWADPAKQIIPAAWYKGTLSNTNPSDAVLNDTIYNYTKRCLQHLVSNGAAPDYVQIGNEVSYGMLWRTTADKCTSYSSEQSWNRFNALLKSASRAVREVMPKAKIILHIERIEKLRECRFVLNKLSTLDYDIIGLSYYPFWHGTISNLGTNLAALASAYPQKEVQIVETAYYYQFFPANNSSYTNTTSLWAGTPEGQKAFLEDLINELNKHNNVTGLYYWCAEENGNGKNSIVINSWLNRGLWNANTNRVLPGLFVLKNFCGDNVMDVKLPAMEGDEGKPVFNVRGQFVPVEAVLGVYIKEGEKYIVR